MHKQFEILAHLQEAYDASVSRLAAMKRSIEELELAIQNDIDTVLQPLLDSYPHEQDIMYLACFPCTGVIELYRISLARVEYIHLSWYHLDREPYVCPKEDEPQTIPKSEEEMRRLLNSYYSPTRIRMDCYETFGYFDDINDKYTRKDWILEKLKKRDILFEIDKADFIRAVRVVYDTYSCWCNDNIAPRCSSDLLVS
jgi:hypothetical protein